MNDLPTEFNKPATLTDAQIEAIVKAIVEFAQREVIRAERRRVR
jgi:hypothetical protein